MQEDIFKCKMQGASKIKKSKVQRKSKRLETKLAVNAPQSHPYKHLGPGGVKSKLLGGEIEAPGK